MQSIDPNIKSLFSQAYVLGGSPCSGKSSIAQKIFEQLGFQLYQVDDHQDEHLQRCQPDRHPIMWKYSRMEWNKIWAQPVAKQVEEVFGFNRERFGMILDDLYRFDSNRPILLEGAAFQPELMKTAGIHPRKILYLIPTKEFQIYHYSQRPWIKDILKECDDPKQAFENWMERDYLFGQEILQQASILRYGVIIVDGSKDMDVQFTQVIEYYDLKVKPL